MSTIRPIGDQRQMLIKERVRYTSRIKGLLASQGITGFEPLRPVHRAGLEALKTGDGRPRPSRLSDEIRPHLGRLDAVLRDLAAVEKACDAMIGVTTRFVLSCTLQRLPICRTFERDAGTNTL
jgi:transposase